MNPSQSGRITAPALRHVQRPDQARRGIQPRAPADQTRPDQTRADQDPAQSPRPEPDHAECQPRSQPRVQLYRPAVNRTPAQVPEGTQLYSPAIESSSQPSAQTSSEPSPPQDQSRSAAQRRGAAHAPSTSPPGGQRQREATEHQTVASIGTDNQLTAQP